jgi:adenosylcobinamide kinase/adenosylcobinamide-phosphate guanylyltransferase
VRYLAPGRVGPGAGAWAQRIAEHRRRRPAHWSTVETEEIASQLRQAPTPTLVDDLGVWLTGMLDRHHGWGGGSVPVAVRDEIDDMLAAVDAFASALVLVSPEVGLTVVPATASGRRFADELGTLNQKMAAVCDRVVLLVAGQAVPIKPSGI